MAKSKRTVWECDNPECLSAQIEWPYAEQEVLGFWLGKGSWSTENGGGPLPRVYVCSVECLAPAVKRAMFEDEEAQR